MQFDLRSFYEKGSQPYKADFTVDLSGEDFGDYQVLQPAKCTLLAVNHAREMELQVSVDAVANAECARCLDPVEETISFIRQWILRERDFDENEMELPYDAKGLLDLDELVFQEIVLEVPPVLLCSPDCLGLCPICGKKKAAGCTCHQAEDAAPVDARLSILKELLN